MWPMSTDDEFNFLFTEVLSMANGGGAATSEVLRAASQIIPGDFDSWYDEFNWLGDRVHQLAIEAKTAVSRRKALFRAASYYQMASFFLTGNASDSRLYTSYQNGLDDFYEAISLMKIPGEIFSAPGDGFDIPGYFFKAQSDNNTKLPTIVMSNGYDGNQEEVFHMLGPEALERGYNYVTFEGPGQPSVRRYQGIGFIPDWWNVVTPVVDYLAQRPDVDMDNVVLVGLSFSGQLAPLAASREHRLKAVMSIDGLVDMQKAILDQLPDQLLQAFNSGNSSYFDYIMSYALSLDSTATEFKWVTNQGLWSFNTTSYYDWLSQLGQYALAQEDVNNITALPFVAKGEIDDLVGGQEATLMEYYSNAGANATYHLFEENLGAGLHCQLGAEPYLAEVVYDWLDGIFTQ
jgi:esterase/lipase